MSARNGSGVDPALSSPITYKYTDVLQYLTSWQLLVLSFSPGFHDLLREDESVRNAAFYMFTNTHNKKRHIQWKAKLGHSLVSLL